MNIILFKFILFVLLVAHYPAIADTSKTMTTREVNIQKILPECPLLFIRGAIVSHDGAIWVAGEQGGIYKLFLGERYASTWFDMRYFRGMPETDAFTCIAEDLQHRIWAGTDNKGVAVFNGEKWQTYDRENALPGDHIYSIAVSPVKGIVAVATSGGISLYDPGKDQWQDLTRANGLVEDQVESLSFDGKDRLWAAYSCGGIASSSPQNNYRDWNTNQAKWYWDASQSFRQPLKSKGAELPSNLCNVILTTREGSVLAGTCAGLGKLNAKGEWSYVRGQDYAAKNKDTYTFSKNKKPPEKMDRDSLLPEDYVTCLTETDKGYWVGTRSGGAALLGKNRLNVIKSFQGDNKHPLTCKWIRSILELPNGTVLGATYGKGIAVLFPHSERGTISVDKNMPSVVPMPCIKAPLEEEEFVKALRKSEKMKGQSAQAPAFFLDEDWSTLGDWCFRYGNRRGILCGSNAPRNDGITVDPSYFRLHKAPRNKEGIEYIQTSLYRINRTLGPLRTPDDSIRSWVMTVNDPASRSILYNYEYAIRTKSDWDDHGEAYPQSLDGPDIWLIVDVPKGISTASLYFFNQKGFQIPPDAQRDYLVEVKRYKPSTDPGLFPLSFLLAEKFSKAKAIEGENVYMKDLENMIKAPVLARCRVKDFISTPVYKTFAIEGPATYCIRICRNNSFNTIISGVFLGQDKTFQTPESMDHLDPCYYQTPLNPFPLQEASSQTESIFRQAMKMSDNDLVINGIEWSKRRSLLLEGIRFWGQTPSKHEAILSHARWALKLWNTSDREQFDTHMKNLWDICQENSLGMRSREFTPHSPGTIPFSLKEVRAMHELGINWKDYRDDAPKSPSVSVSDMKKILQEHIKKNNKQTTTSKL